MKKHISPFLLMLFIFLTPFINGQNLRRQVDFGAMLADLSEEKAAQMGLEGRSGALLTTLIPSGSAEVMELAEQDIVLSVDAKEVVSPESLEEIFSQYRGGDEVSIKVWRAGQEMELTGVLLAREKEDPGLGQILYDEVPFEGGYLRTITQRPTENDEPMPGLLFIPGYPCTSIDNLSTWHPYKKLVDELADKGIAVMRIEKSGLGDCMNTPDCADLSLDLEKEVYKSGLNKLRSYDFVDTNNLFVLGHDMGGMLAPLIAIDSGVSVKGLIVYGTILESWLEHINQLARYQHPMMGGDYVESSGNQKDLLTLSFELFENKKSPRELAGEKESYKEILEKSFDWNGYDYILGRHYTFWQSVQDLNLTEAWSSCDAYVFSLAGQADAQILSPTQHKEIVKIVNTYHPEKATYMMVPKTNHAFIEVGSMKEGIDAAKDPETMFGLYQSKFNFDLVDKMAEWIMDKVNK